MIGQKLKRLMHICTYWPDGVQQANPETDHEFRYAKATPYAENCRGTATPDAAQQKHVACCSAQLSRDRRVTYGVIDLPLSCQQCIIVH